MFRGDYVVPETDEPVSTVKLVPIALSPDDEKDEEDTGMLNNKVAPAKDEEPTGPTPEELEGRTEDTSFNPLNDLKELVANLAVDDAGVNEEDENVDFTLVQAAAEGDITIVKERVNEMRANGKQLDIELNLTDNHNFTALHMAARYNRKNVVNYLIDNGADMNKVGNEGLTPLHLATK